MDTQPELQPSAPDRKAIIFVVVTVILNTMGFTLIVPVAPFLVARYVSDPAILGATVGWLGSIYAICQFTAAPGLGALSDRFGRRPILMICLLGSALGYLLLGVGGALWVLLLGRAIDGLTGANTSILIAYIADVVPSEERGKYFGLLGAIGAISVVLGPAAGGLMAKLGYEVPFYVACAVCSLNVIFGLLFMPESLPKAKRTPSISLRQLNPIATLRDVFSLPQLRWLLVATFFYTLATVIVPSNLGLFTKDSVAWDADTVGIMFSVFGVVTIVVQGFLLSWLRKRLSAARVTSLGLWFTFAATLCIALVAAVGSSALVYVGIILFGVGDGLTSPALLELVTGATDERSHGKVQGGSQSVQSLANIIGPLLAGGLYDRLGHASPYLGGAGIVVLAYIAITFVAPTLRRIANVNLEEPAP
ncbi:MAG: MFS transporter [Anaerolineae bacterium]|nr:MFS transporter [Anaerolineae bacterium]